MAFWLLAEHAVESIRDRMRLMGDRSPPQALIDAVAARVDSARRGEPRILSIAGDVAEIRIEGVLSPEPDIWASFFGEANTGYSEIIAALAAADADPAVSRVVMKFASPGGTVDGYHETVDAIRAVRKPMSAVASMACSAAYGLSVNCGTVAATSVASWFGSVGVATSIFVSPFWKDFASTEAPEKRPDPETEEGVKAIQSHLDRLHELFVATIADGLGTTVERVNADFGRGSVVFANAALAAGMIHSVPAPTVSRNRNPAVSVAVADGMEESMTFEEYRAKFPAEAAAAIEAARVAGQATEKSRVQALVTVTKSTKDFDALAGYIDAGASVTDPAVQADLLAAAQNRIVAAQRAADTDLPVGAAPAADGSSLLEQALSVLKKEGA